MLMSLSSPTARWTDEAFMPNQRLIYWDLFNQHFVFKFCLFCATQFKWHCSMEIKCSDWNAMFVLKLCSLSVQTDLPPMKAQVMQIREDVRLNAYDCDKQKQQRYAPTPVLIAKIGLLQTNKVFLLFKNVLKQSFHQLKTWVSPPVKQQWSSVFINKKSEPELSCTWKT